MCNKGPLGGITFCLAVCVVVYGVGFATPGWSIVPEENDYKLGLWQVCTTEGNIPRCKLTLDDDTLKHAGWFEATQILASIGMSGLLILLVFSVCSMTARPERTIPCLGLVTVSSFINSMVIFAAAGLFASNVPDKSSLSYSFALVIAGGLLCFVCVLLGCLRCCCRHRYAEAAPLLGSSESRYESI